MNINPSRGSDAPLGFNASNQSLINTLLQQASKSSEKKRPTFEEVFAKLNARSARMDANKNPINNMLTNEQLFRYYIKETEPKLQISNEIFSGEELFNPMKESDPNKSYGTASTLTSDIAQLSDPANNLPNPIIPEPITAPAPRPLQNIPRQNIPRKIPNLSLEVPIFATEPVTVLSTVDLVIQEANQLYTQAVREEDRLDKLNQSLGSLGMTFWNNLPDETLTLLKLFVSPANPMSNSPLYYLQSLIKEGKLETTLEGLFNIFSGTKDDETTNNFIVNNIMDMIGVDLSSGSAVKPKFDAEFNPNTVSLQTFIENIKPKLNQPYTDRERTRIDGEINVSNYGSLPDLLNNKIQMAKQDTEDKGKNYYDLLGVKRILNAPPAIDPAQAYKDAVGIENKTDVFRGAMGDLFSDTATSAETNTDINSLSIDPQIVNVLNKPDSSLSYSFLKPPTSLSSITLPSSEAGSGAEAGSGEVDVDNVVRRRGERGPDKEPRSRRTNKQIQQELLMGLMGAKGGK